MDNYKFNINSIISKDYIDPIHLDSIDDFSYRKLVSKKKFRYGSLVGLPTEIYTKTSNIEKVYETKYYYPPHAPITGLSETEVNNYQLLSSSHIWSPVQTEQYIGNYFTLPMFNDTIIEGGLSQRKLSTQRTIYNSELLPQRVQSSIDKKSLGGQGLY